MRGVYAYFGGVLMNGFEHGGNIYTAARQANCPLKDIIDLSSNISPFLPEALLDGLDVRSLISRLPEPYSSSLVRETAAFHDVPEHTIIAGSGTTEFIHKICRIYGGKKAVVLQPTYVDYAKYIELADIKRVDVIMSESSGFAYDEDELMQNLNDADLCFICNPNNPTGKLICKDELRFVADMFKKTLFVIDESYIDFCVDKKPSLIGCSLNNIVVLRSFSKSYGIPGLRAGYLFSRNKPLIDTLNKSVSPWSMNTIAQRICHKAIKEVVMPNLIKLDNIKHQTLAMLSENTNLKAYDSSANYLLIKLLKSDADSFYEYMLSHKILIRNCSNFVGLDNSFIRISIKELKHMETFCRLAKVYFDIF